MQKELVTTECSKPRNQTADGQVLIFAGLKKKHEPKSFWFNPCGFFIVSPFYVILLGQKKRVMKSEENTFSNAYLNTFSNAGIVACQDWVVDVNDKLSETQGTTYLPTYRPIYLSIYLFKFLAGWARNWSQKQVTLGCQEMPIVQTPSKGELPLGTRSGSARCGD